MVRRIRNVFLALGIVYFFGFLLKNDLGGTFARQQAERTYGLVSFVMEDSSYLSYPDKDRAAQILSQSEKLGVFECNDVNLLVPKEAAADDIYSNDDFQGQIEVYNGAHITGWAFIPGKNATNSQIFILLTDGSQIYELEALKVERPDVSQAHNTRFQYDDSGYQAFLSIYEIPDGNYKIGVFVRNGDKQAVTWSEYVYSAR